MAAVGPRRTSVAALELLRAILAEVRSDAPAAANAWSQERDHATEDNGSTAKPDQSTDLPASCTNASPARREDARGHRRVARETCAEAAPAIVSDEVVDELIVIFPRASSIGSRSCT